MQQGHIDHGALAYLARRQVVTFDPGAYHDGFIAHADPLGKLLPGHQRWGTVQLLGVKTFRIHKLCSTMLSNFRNAWAGTQVNNYLRSIIDSTLLSRQ